ncbi:MAG TPA: HAD family hydrolase [Phenylobacterium sp.]|uniref:HAD family hydrolase n=1 Tax=Phenylobacterium sp. TaxID=1871053 RepID=UPI002C732718|nr:HAD family hydrolase [Phenylobacterium sp.]HSV03251.1 HAD family hydrolase [Phenylobacterium sp.]
MATYRMTIVSEPGPAARGAIALLIADVDGTLVTPDKILTPAAIDAVRRLGEAGVGFTIVSSRPPRGMAPIVEQLDITLPFAAFNGGSLVAPSLTLIEAHRLPQEAARTMLALLSARHVDAWAYADGDWRVRDPTSAWAPRERRALGYGPTQVDNFDDVIGRIDKLVGVSDDAALLASVEAAARQLLGATVTINRSQTYALDITHPKANKGEAVRGLCQRIGVDLRRTAVIGDMINDVAMFAQAGFSIAMGNAAAEVKAQADASTDTNENDGFAKAVRRFVLSPAAAPTGGHA